MNNLRKLSKIPKLGAYELNGSNDAILPKYKLLGSQPFKGGGKYQHNDQKLYKRLRNEEIGETVVPKKRFVVAGNNVRHLDPKAVVIPKGKTSRFLKRMEHTQSSIQKP